jgi:PAS domain S-box-containing protein
MEWEDGPNRQSSFHESEDSASSILSQDLMSETHTDREDLMAENRRLRERLAELEDAQERLRASEERYRLLFERNLAGVLVSRPDGQIVECNDALLRILGYESREEIIGLQAWNFYFSMADRQAFVQQLQAQGALVNHEIRFRRKDGSAAHCLTNVSLLRGSHGEQILHGTIVDVSAQRRLEEQVRQTLKMEAVGRLAGGVAHDFNGLLTVIIGYSEILLSTLEESDPSRSMVREIQKAGERGARLTRHLLAFSRKQILRPQELDLNQVVAELEAMLRRVVGENITLVVTCEPTLGRIHADVGQIEQVLVTLVVNARDAMPIGGQIFLDTANVDLPGDLTHVPSEVRPGHYVRLRIRDTGQGMDEETRAHLFEPFFTTKAVGEGTGLGLAMVYGVIKQSGGHVEVESAPNQGTTITLYLPRFEIAAPEPAVQANPFTPTLRGQTVLLVEDEAGVRKLARHLLESQGLNVLDAGNGPEALALAARRPGRIDLLVTDVIMPHMSGRELADRLTGQRPDLKVLFLSGYSQDVIGNQGILPEGVAFLSKPFTPAALAEQIHSLLKG